MAINHFQSSTGGKKTLMEEEEEVVVVVVVVVVVTLVVGCVHAWHTCTGPSWLFLKRSELIGGVLLCLDAVQLLTAMCTL